MDVNSDINAQSSSQSNEFFLPDLCNTQAVLFLVLVAELLAIVLELAATGLHDFSWQSFSLRSLYLQWVFLMNASLLCKLRPHLKDWPLARAAVTCYLLILSVLAATSLLGQWLLEIYGLGGGVDVVALLSHVLIGAVLAGIALRYFYLTQQLRLNQRAELQSRIQALQSRIRPHFLFNSMNIIASLIAVDQEAAEEAVEDLAELFRASLAEMDTEVALADEIELCRRYARIEQLRLGDRLEMVWQLDAIPLSLKIPSLSLQPLLENAIYHGIQQLPTGGTVTIRANYQDSELQLEVISPMAEKTQNEEDGGNRLAQDNINRRLQALYGPKAGLFSRIENDQYCAMIRYPVPGREK